MRVNTMATKALKVKNASKIVIQMTETCYGRNTKFKNALVANEAADQYSKERGYPVEPYWCESCKCLHVRATPTRADSYDRLRPITSINPG
jgi:hypothetical protein